MPLAGIRKAFAAMRSPCPCELRHPSLACPSATIAAQKSGGRQAVRAGAFETRTHWDRHVISGGAAKAEPTLEEPNSDGSGTRAASQFKRTARFASKHNKVCRKAPDRAGSVRTATATSPENMWPRGAPCSSPARYTKRRDFLDLPPRAVHLPFTRAVEPGSGRRRRSPEPTATRPARRLLIGHFDSLRSSTCVPMLSAARPQFHRLTGREANQRSMLSFDLPANSSSTGSLSRAIRGKSGKFP